MVKRSVRIINTLVIIIGILVLCADFIVAVQMDLGNPVATFTNTANAQNIVQRPILLFMGAIASLALIGGFLIIYPALCLRRGVSCIRFR